MTSHSNMYINVVVSSLFKYSKQKHHHVTKSKTSLSHRRPWRGPSYLASCRCTRTASRRSGRSSRGRGCRSCCGSTGCRTPRPSSTCRTRSTRGWKWSSLWCTCRGPSSCWGTSWCWTGRGNTHVERTLVTVCLGRFGLFFSMRALILYTSEFILFILFFLPFCFVCPVFS